MATWKRASYNKRIYDERPLYDSPDQSLVSRCLTSVPGFVFIIALILLTYTPLRNYVLDFTPGVYKAALGEAEVIEHTFSGSCLYPIAKFFNIIEIGEAEDFSLGFIGYIVFHLLSFIVWGLYWLFWHGVSYLEFFFKPDIFIATTLALFIIPILVFFIITLFNHLKYLPIYFKNSLFRLDSAIDVERDNLGIEKGERHYIDLDISSADAENSLSGTSLPSLFVSYDSIYRDLYVDLNNDDTIL